MKSKTHILSKFLNTCKGPASTCSIPFPWAQHNGKNFKVLITVDAALLCSLWMQNFQRDVCMWLVRICYCAYTSICRGVCGFVLCNADVLPGWRKYGLDFPVLFIPSPASLDHFYGLLSLALSQEWTRWPLKATGFIPGKERPGRDVDHLPSSNSEVDNVTAPRVRLGCVATRKFSGHSVETF